MTNKRHEWRTDEQITSQTSLSYLASVWAQRENDISLQLSVIESHNIIIGAGKKEETYPINLVTGERMAGDAK